MKLLENLHHLFYPKSVAVIGASADPMKMGHHVLVSLVNSFKGRIYPVNPKYDMLLNLKVYPSLQAIPDEVDLAVIVVPANAVPRALEDCGMKGIKGAVTISAGFKETGATYGEELQREIADIANKYEIAVIGPNTFGIVNPHANLNASFTPYLSKLEKGGIALVSQSGGVCHTLAPYALKYKIGLSKIMSLGNRLNVDFPEMLEYLLTDDDTKSIALYIEGIDNPRDLMNVARKVIPSKPIVVYKVGKFSKADVVAFSHTGSLAGNYQLYDAAFKQVGMIPTNDCLELISVAKALAYQPPAKSDRISIISLVAGPGMIMAEVCNEYGLKLANLSAKTKKELESIIPPMTIRSNPIDVGLLAGDEERSGRVIDIVFEDRNVDAIIVCYIFSWYGPFLKFPVSNIIEAYKTHEKPTVVCLAYPNDSWTRYRDKLEENRIPTFPTPELAAKAMWGLVEYGDILRRKYKVAL